MYSEILKHIFEVIKQAGKKMTFLDEATIMSCQALGQCMIYDGVVNVLSNFLLKITF